MDLLNYAKERDEGRSTDDLVTVTGAYFHGFCDKGDDLVYVKEGTALPEAGIHDVTVYGQQAKLYYWFATQEGWGVRGRGLVVLEGTDCAADAKMKYEEKRGHL